jgi:hypothetical protein
VTEVTGKDPGEDACFAWPQSFPRVVVVGSFAHDRGCMNVGLFVDRTFHAVGGEVAGLATRGFASAGMTDKESLARAWIDEVEHAWDGSFLTAATTAFSVDDSPKFAPVRVRADKVGGVVVEGWVQQPPGMSDESAFVFVSYRFAKDGALSRDEKQTFAVDGARIREKERGAAKPPPSPHAVEMTGFDVSCERASDCTVVNPNKCGPCGCANTPLANKEEAKFEAAYEALACPPREPLPDGAGCGGCMTYKSACDAGKCVAKPG